MCLVRHLNLDGVPEIYVFHCLRCQHVETMTQETRASYLIAVFLACRFHHNRIAIVYPWARTEKALTAAVLIARELRVQPLPQKRNHMGRI